MASDFGIVYPLWDYAADDGRYLDEVAGAVGLDHLTVPVVTGAHTEFRLGSGGETPHFFTEGGWHFRVRTKGYGGTALRPTKGRWFASGDVLAEVRARAAKLGVRLVLRLDLRAVRALVDAEPHVRQRNAWSQEVPFAGACALNPDVRELLRATLEDLQRYEAAGYELVDWAPDNAVDRHAARPLVWHAAARELLDICFCASCRQVAQRAGVDPDQAARSVRVRVEQAVTGASGSELADDPVVTAYVAARAQDTCQWLQRLAEGNTAPQYFLVRLFDEAPLGHCAPWVRMVRLPGGAADEAGWAVRRKALPEISALALPAWRPTFGEAAELVRFVAEAVRSGVSMLDFEGLNEGPTEAITWLKQAVRFARRE